MKAPTLLTVIVFCLMVLPSSLLNSQNNELLFVPHIQYEKAILSGRIEGLEPGEKGFKSITLSYSRLITADRAQYDIQVNKDGTFSIRVPVECIVVAYIASDYYEGPIFLLPGEETKLEILYEEDQKKQVRMVNSLGLTTDDGKKIMKVITEAIEKGGWGGNDSTPEQVNQVMIKKMDEVQKIIERDTTLSGADKQIVVSELKVWMSNTLFKYADDILNEVQNKTNTKPEASQPNIPGKSYYTFLEFLNVNNPSNLSASSYYMVFQYILNNETLAIPSIGEMPVDIWLFKVKKILKEVVGSDSGLFYDILAGNAYAKQMNDMKPLSEIQTKNIQFYFNNSSFVHILMDENEKVLKLATKSDDPRIHIMRDTDRGIMDSILSKYQGKVVFVDFWATWCEPCLAAMKESECVKNEFENKDVVFVDITNSSSLRKVWKQKISDIGGEHYYLTKEEWNSLNKTYDFTAIPHYLIFDKQGVLKINQTTFMGLEKMRKWIEELL